MSVFVHLLISYLQTVARSQPIGVDTDTKDIDIIWPIDGPS